MEKIIVKKPTDRELDEMGVWTWGIWEKEPSAFPWHYDDKETCYLLSGQVTVKTAEEEVSFGKGDLVVFPSGLDCDWVISEHVKKHYKFG